MYDLRNIIAAIFLFGVVAADLIYSVVKGREFLFSWLGLLFAALAIIALFFDQIRKFSFSPKEGVVVEVQEAQVKASANLAAAIARDSGKPGSVEEAASVLRKLSHRKPYAVLKGQSSYGSMTTPITTYSSGERYGRA